MQTNNSLTMQQKETVGLLSIGTCLEWFDVFLYIHMAVLLDQIFFDKNDHRSWILSNIAICSAFVLKPIGGVYLGWLGDKIGRTFIIFMSTFVTGTTCVVIAIMPTYAQIGIIASFAIALCKIMQGIMAAGDFFTADIYVAEMNTKPKKRCAMSMLLCIGSSTGSKFLATALVAIALFCVEHGVTEAWRAAFLCGGFVAVIGIYARRTLYETSNFTEAKKLATVIQTDHKPGVLKESLPKLSLFYYWILTLGMVLFTLFPFTYCKDLLVGMGYSAASIALQSWFVGIFFTVNLIGYFFLVKFVSPFKIAKYRFYGAIALMLFLPYLIQHASSNIDIFILQCLVLLFNISDMPANPLIYKLFPVLTRARSVLIPNAFSGAFGFIFLNFSIPVLSKYFFQYTFVILALPIAILAVFGMQHFQKAYQNSINSHGIESH